MRLPVYRLPDIRRQYFQIDRFPFFYKKVFYAGNEAVLFMRLHLLQAIVLYHQNKREEASNLLKVAENELKELKVDDNSIVALVELGGIASILYSKIEVYKYNFFHRLFSSRSKIRFKSNTR